MRQKRNILRIQTDASKSSLTHMELKHAGQQRLNVYLFTCETGEMKRLNILYCFCLKQYALL